MKSEQHRELDALFWNKVAAAMRQRAYYVQPLLAEYKRREFAALLQQWLPPEIRCALKTDAFEEAFGADEIASLLAKTGRHVIISDIAWSTLAAARGRQALPEMAAVCGDVARLPLADSSMDAIVSTSTFGYAVPVEEALREAFRVLKPGGILIASVNNRWNFIFRILTQLMYMSGALPFPASQAYSRDDFLARLVRVGFSVEQAVPAVHILPLMNSCPWPNLLRWLTEQLRRYGANGNPLRWFTAWFIVFYARKPE